jgi:membrane associated rhomboid family serine protease
VIPLRDINPTRTRPVLTYGLIALNTAVFLFQVSLPDAEFELFVRRYGLIPEMITEDVYFGSLITPFTSMFMHGGWLHLILNMWSLWIFGDNVEDELGKPRFVLFYMLTGLGAAAAQVLVQPSSEVPMVGASGAIAGVLAAYLKLFPGARVVTLIPLFFLFFVREIPAVFFIIVWFGLQVISGVDALGGLESDVGGVAIFAHIGGFVAGLLLVSRLRPGRNLTRSGNHRGNVSIPPPR